MPPRRKIVGAKHRSVKPRSVKPDREICAAVGCAAGFLPEDVKADLLKSQELVRDMFPHDLMKLEGKWSWCRRCGRLREQWWEGENTGDLEKTNRITRWWEVGQLITEGDPACSMT